MGTSSITCIGPTQTRSTYRLFVGAIAEQGSSLRAVAERKTAGQRINALSHACPRRGAPTNSADISKEPLRILENPPLEVNFGSLRPHPERARRDDAEILVERY
jgi:hypothetical protein